LKHSENSKKKSNLKNSPILIFPTNFQASAGIIQYKCIQWKSFWPVVCRVSEHSPTSSSQTENCKVQIRKLPDRKAL